MNLQRVRIQLAMVYGLLSLLTVGVLAWIAVRSGTSRIIDSAEREAEAVITEALQFETPPNTWQVHVDDEWTNPVGDTWVEPALLTIARDALWHGERYTRFEQDGQWLTASRQVEDGLALVAVIPFDEFGSDVTSLRWRIGLAAIGLIAGSTAVGWFIAGRSLRPTRRVLAQQRDFIADAAHELRTPLAVIQASASHALGRDREAVEYRGALVEIQAASERATTGVNELLEFARLEAGQALPRLAPLRLDLLAEEIAASVRHDGTTLEAVLDEPVVVDADYGLLRQAADTVVRNAVVRATAVNIGAFVDGRDGVLAITDDGPGFSDDLLEHVFERFRRGDRKGSSGLGMAIARKIIEVHGGTISAANREDGGAVVTIRVPRSRAIDQ